MKKLLLGLAVLIVSNFIIANTTSSPKLINNSRQLLVVTTDNWNSSTGQLQLYERSNTMQGWQAVGGPISVVVGKTGLAWGAEIKHPPLPGPTKKEGDLKTPAGIFPIGSAFGFATSDIKNLKMPYIRIMPDTVCVDDSKSKFYNRIVNSDTIKKPDWHSGEQMHTVPQYMWGVQVDYNAGKKPILNGGSCIFMHIWKGPQQGTVGCVAMPESNIEQLTTWLNSKRKPMLVILTKPAYKTLKKSWNLPV